MPTFGNATTATAQSRSDINAANVRNETTRSPGYRRYRYMAKRVVSRRFSASTSVCPGFCDHSMDVNASAESRSRSFDFLHALRIARNCVETRARTMIEHANLTILRARESSSIAVKRKATGLESV